MRSVVRLFKEVHDIGGCDGTTEWDQGWDAAIETCEDIITEIFGVDYDDVEAEDDIEEADNGDTPELKPCPFCGSPARLIHQDLEEDPCTVFCNACGVATSLEKNEAEAVKVWNRRFDKEPDDANA